MASSLRQGLRRVPRAAWALLAAALAARIAVAYATYGVRFDIDSYRIVYAALDGNPFDVYTATSDAEQIRWPYAPGFFPWVIVAGLADSHLGIPFDGTVQLAAIAADGALALLVYIYLDRRGESTAKAFGAFAVVCLGPTFAATSGYHGQLDSVAILAAVAALIAWEQLEGRRRRAVVCGLVLGLGVAVKTVPVLLLIALLPWATDRREALRLVAWTALIPAALLLPYAITDPGSTLDVFRNAGLPGFGGLSLVVQPELSSAWLVEGSSTAISALNDQLYDLGRLIALALIVCLAMLAWRLRPPPLKMAVIIWLSVYVFNPDLFLHYLIWGLPFLLMAGYVWQAVVLQTVVIIPTALLYGGPWEGMAASHLYSAVSIGLWAWALVALSRIVFDVRAPRPPLAAQADC